VSGGSAASETATAKGPASSGRPHLLEELAARAGDKVLDLVAEPLLDPALAHRQELVADGRLDVVLAPGVPRIRDLAVAGRGEGLDDAPLESVLDLLREGEADRDERILLGREVVEETG
jgi:hypothetical protein